MTCRLLVTCVAVVALTVGGDRTAEAQGADRLWNGTVIGAATGAGVGVFFTHAVRDSDLTFTQYMRGALIFGAFGAGAGLGVDALLNRTRDPLAPERRISIAPAAWRHFAGISVKCRW